MADTLQQYSNFMLAMVLERCQSERTIVFTSRNSLGVVLASLSFESSALTIGCESLLIPMIVKVGEKGTTDRISSR